MSHARVRAVDSAGNDATDTSLHAFRVTIAGGAGSGGTSAVDEAAFTAGVSAGTPMMAVVNPSDTPADGVLGIPAMDAARRLKVVGTFSAGAIQSNTTSTPTQTTIGTTAAQLLAANANRKRMILQNCGTTVIKVVLGAATPTQSAYTFALPPGGNTNDGSSARYTDDMWTGAVQIISSASGGLINAVELT